MVAVQCGTMVPPCLKDMYSLKTKLFVQRHFPLYVKKKCGENFVIFSFLIRIQPRNSATQSFFPSSCVHVYGINSKRKFSLPLPKRGAFIRTNRPTKVKSGHTTMKLFQVCTKPRVVIGSPVDREKITLFKGKRCDVVISVYSEAVFLEIRFLSLFIFTASPADPRMDGPKLPLFYLPSILIRKKFLTFNIPTLGGEKSSLFSTLFFDSG